MMIFFGTIKYMSPGDSNHSSFSVCSVMSCFSILRILDNLFEGHQSSLYLGDRGSLGLGHGYDLLTERLKLEFEISRHILGQF